MFQYATKHEVYEDTGLITLEEAKDLVEKWLPHMKEHWDDFNSPQMVIWKDCESETDYHTEHMDIDYRDCEQDNGSFYRVTREK